MRVNREREGERATNLLINVDVYTSKNGQGSRAEDEANRHRLVIMVVLTMFVC